MMERAVRRGWWRWGVMLLLCAGFVLGGAGAAMGQKKGAGKKGKAAGKAAAKAPKPKFVLRIDKGDTVRGTIQKPEAFYILPRTSLNFEGLLMKRSFVPKIVEAVRRAPF